MYLHGRHQSKAFSDEYMFVTDTQSFTRGKLTHGSKTFFDIGELIITVTSCCLLVSEPVRDVNDAPAIEAGEVASHL